MRIGTNVGLRWLGKGVEMRGQCTPPESLVRPFKAAYVAASVRLAVAVLLSMLLTWLPTVRKLMKSSSAISRSVLPPHMSCRTSTSRCVRPSGYAEALTG